MVKTCGQCGKKNNDPLAVFCNKCGSRLPELHKEICSYCGAEVRSKDSAFCTKCGARISSSQYIQKTPQQIKGGKICPECGFEENESDRSNCRRCGSFIQNPQQGDESIKKKSIANMIRIIPDAVNISPEPKIYPTGIDKSPPQKQTPVMQGKGTSRNKQHLLPKLLSVDFASFRRVALVGIVLLILIFIGIIVISFAPAIISGENSSGDNLSGSTAIRSAGAVRISNNSSVDSTSDLTPIPFTRSTISGTNPSEGKNDVLTAVPPVITTVGGSPFSNSGNPVGVDSPVEVRNP